MALQCPATRPRIEVGSKVAIVGEPGTYLVMRVDPLRYIADLMLMGRTAKVELGIHFSAIRSLPNPVGRSFNWPNYRVATADAEQEANVL